MTPKISVVMPVYNAERYLRPAIESILNQTFTDFELIAVNDCSNDNSWAILSEYAERDSRMVLVNNSENLGEAGARNAGNRLIRGEYMAVQDADDISLPNRFQLEADYLDNHPNVGLIAGNAQRIDAQGNILSVWTVPTDPQVLRAGLLLNNPLPHTTVMVRHAVLKQVGGYRTTVHTTDYDLWWRISQVSEIHTLTEPLAYYRSDDKDQNRITVGQSSHQLRGSQTVSLEAAKALMNGQPFDHEAYKRFFLSTRGINNSLKPGDIRRLQPLWDVLAADPLYRQLMGPKLLSCCVKNTVSSPGEALQLLNVINRQFNISVDRIARKYVRSFLLQPLTDHKPLKLSS
jgi:glycosyltransferase involved in cell wall biosynthesis